MIIVTLLNVFNIIVIAAILSFAVVLIIGQLIDSTSNILACIRRNNGLNNRRSIKREIRRVFLKEVLFSLFVMSTVLFISLSVCATSSEIIRDTISKMVGDHIVTHKYSYESVPYININGPTKNNFYGFSVEDNETIKIININGVLYAMEKIDEFSNGFVQIEIIYSYGGNKSINITVSEE